MLHWIPAPTVAFAGARSRAEPVLPGDTPARCAATLRAMHALMLAYAAQRRRAAVETVDSVYWKAAEANALDKARLIRADVGFGRLP